MPGQDTSYHQIINTFHSSIPPPPFSLRETAVDQLRHNVQTTTRRRRNIPRHILESIRVLGAIEQHKLVCYRLTSRHPNISKPLRLVLRNIVRPQRQDNVICIIQCITEHGRVTDDVRVLALSSLVEKLEDDVGAARRFDLLGAGGEGRRVLAGAVVCAEFTGVGDLVGGATICAPGGWKSALATVDGCDESGERPG